MDLANQITHACREQLYAAIDKLGLPQWAAQTTCIDTQLKGRAAGKFVYRKLGWLSKPRLTLSFNLQAATLDPERMLGEVIPHELAHLAVALRYPNRRLRPHGPEWRALCLELGGSGEVYHRLDTTHAYRQRRWQYRDSLGALHQLTTTRHNRLQAGQRYRVNGSGAELSAAGLVAELGD